MLKLDEKQEKRAKRLHAASLIVDAHSDVHLDV